jgi:hypothetical protein
MEPVGRAVFNLFLVLMLCTVVPIACLQSLFALATRLVVVPTRIGRGHAQTGKSAPMLSGITRPRSSLSVGR